MATKDIVVVLEFDDKGSYKIKKAIGEVSKVMITADAEAGKAAQGFMKLRTSAQQATTGFNGLKGSIKSTGIAMAAGMGVMMGITGSIAMLRRGISSVIQTGEKFSKTFADTSTMIQGSTEEIEKMRMAVIRISPHLGSTTDLAHGLYQVLSASVPKENAISFLEASAKAAKAGATDTFTAVDALTTVLNAYGMKAAEVTKVSDIMFNTVLRGKTTYQELASSIGNVATMASQVGVSFEEVSAAISTLTRVGIDSTKATTSLRMVFSTLLGPQKAAIVLSKQLGIDFSMAGVRAKGFAGWLKDVIDKTGGSTEKLDVLFGNIRALTGIMALAGPEFENFVGDIKLMKEATGATDTAFRKIMKSTAFWMDSLRNVREKFQIGLFEGLTEGFFKGLKTQEEIQAKFEKFAQSVFTAGKNIGEAINKMVMFFVRLKDEIALVAKVWFMFFVANTVTSWAAKVVLAINASSTSLVGLKVATMGAATAFGTLAGAIGIAIAATQVLLWARDKLHLSMDKSGEGMTAEKKQWKEIGEGLTQAATGMKGLVAWTDISKLLGKELQNTWRVAGKGYRDVSPELKKLDDLWHQMGENTTETLKAIASGAAGQEMKDLLNKLTKGESDTASAATVLTDELNKMNAALKNAGQGGNDAKTAMEILREKLKAFGYNLKTDLEDRYNTLTEAIQTMKGEITETDFEKLKKDQRDLAALLGRTSAGLLHLGILTKDEVAVEVQRITKDFNDLKSAAESGIITWYQYREGLDMINEELGKLDPTIRATIHGMKKLAETPLPKPRNLGDIMALAPGVMTPEQMMGPEVQYPTPPPRYFAGFQDEKAELLGIQRLTKYRYQLVELEEAYRSLKITQDITHQDEITALGNIAAIYKQLGLEVPKEYQKILDAAEKATKGQSTDMIKGFSTLATALQVLGDNVSDRLRALVQTGASVAGQIAASLTKQLNDMGGKGTLKFSNLTKAFKELGGELAGQLGAALGGALGGGGANTYGGIGAALGGALGSIIPGVGNVIGSLVGGLFGGLFKKKKSAEEKAAEELKKQVESVQKSYKSLGDISEATAKKILDLTKQFNRQTATILTLTDVMSDAGISMKNLSGYISKMKTALYDIARGTVDAQKGVEAIGSAFNSLINWAQKFGTEGSKALVGFIQYLRKLGVSIAEVDDYVFDQLSSGSAGLKKMVDSAGGASYKQLIEYRDQIKELGAEVENLSMSKISERSAQREYLQKKAQLEELRKKYDDLKGTLASELEPELERLGRLTVATFNSFLAQGKSITETFSTMGEGLVALRDKYTELGLTGGAALEDLFKLVDIQKANEDLFAGLDGTKQLLEALGNTGFLSAESIADLAAQAGGYFTQLTDAGLDSKQALAMIAPTLADLEYYAKQYGLVLDDDTKKLIDQAKEMGVFKEKGKDLTEVLKEGFDGIIDRLDQLIGRIGKGMVGAWDEATAAATRYAGRAGRGGAEEGETTYAQHGFEGTVTGPRTFYVEPGVTESVKIGRPGSNKNGTEEMMTLIEKNVTIEPMVIPWEAMKSFIVEFIQKGTADERVLIRPRAIRGRG